MGVAYDARELYDTHYQLYAVSGYTSRRHRDAAKVRAERLK